MKLNDRAEAILKKLHARRVNGDGYVVEIIMPAVIRYCETGRTLTFGLEPNGSRVDIYVETPATWDNESEPMSQLEVELAISRIKAALIKKKLNYELFYRQAPAE